ncbi:MAG: cupin domain-containing protein [Methylomonas sp.]|jgi:uncharacterized cupin superfamily protein|uniref:cupin domain-containing protein n=1 Tax=Methylomonas sp. TaxID=418 RepID=UPI0025FB6787|nr:cupin domain-containing protein [Methylomonas sp.]MCK9605782.1 cupin domain-containing protein [Methylomonas sp.]
MTESTFPIAAVADQVPPRTRKSLYPQAILDAHGARLEGREKRLLGELFGLQNFGVNLTRLAPEAISALRHAHSQQDEFIYILQGCPTLYTDAGPTPLSPGMCAGFKAGSGDAHRLVNETANDVVYLEIGDRSAGDQVVYPDDDLQAAFVDSIWRFLHKDGTPY